VPNVKKIRNLNLPETPWATSACCRRPLPLRFTAVLSVLLTVLTVKKGKCLRILRRIIELISYHYSHVTSDSIPFCYRLFNNADFFTVDKNKWDCTSFNICLYIEHRKTVPVLILLLDTFFFYKQFDKYTCNKK
jgi:hypothetical protein